jgi:hypothetical protein
MTKRNDIGIDQEVGWIADDEATGAWNDTYQRVFARTGSDARASEAGAAAYKCIWDFTVQIYGTAALKRRARS